MLCNGEYQLHSVLLVQMSLLCVQSIQLMNFTTCHIILMYHLLHIKNYSKDKQLYKMQDILYIQSTCNSYIYTHVQSHKAKCLSSYLLCMAASSHCPCSYTPCCSANCSARSPLPVCFTACTTVCHVRGRSPVPFS